MADHRSDNQRRRLLQAALLDAFAEAGGQIEPAQLVSLRFGAEEVTVETRRPSVSFRPSLLDE